ncbi:MAG: isoprenylcysteine carboxyl methyltransferase [Acidimicrobiales bacterium]|nr:isoprenylcysteine carboxyl methyltransferase [Acidimicrobiales bacterium]
MLTETKQPTARTFDWGHVVSKAALICVYVVFAAAHVSALQEDGFRLSLVLLVAFETVMIGMVLARRATDDVDKSMMAVFAGLAGSFFVLGFRPAGSGEDVLIGQVIQVSGILLQLGASLSLGRSFGLVPANRGIKTGGLYRIVRHPFYFSYVIAQIGYLINNPSTMNVVVFAIGTGFQVVRINYEERLLSNNAEYSAYLKTVRWHLFPGIW